MFRKAGGRMNLTRTVSLVVLVATLLILAVSIARAQWIAQAFGVKYIDKVRGNRAYIWTGTPPDGEYLTASPMGVSEDYWGYEKWFETGWATGTYIDNELQQYVGFVDIDGGVVNHMLHRDYGDDLLYNNTWYQFKAMYSKSAARWEAWRFNDVVWYAPYDLGWRKGYYAFVGSENVDPWGWMNVYAWHPEYKKGTNPWILYNHTSERTDGGGCVDRVYDYGLHAWGPCD